MVLNAIIKNVGPHLNTRTAKIATPAKMLVPQLVIVMISESRSVFSWMGL